MNSQSQGLAQPVIMILHLYDAMNRARTGKEEKTLKNKKLTIITTTLTLLILVSNIQMVFAQQILQTSDPMPKVWENGILWVLPPGNSTHPVEYKHPDNYDTYHPGEINIHYVIHGTNGVTAVHLSYTEVRRLYDLQYPSYIGAAIFGLAALLAAVPEPVISKGTGLVFSVMAILFGLAGSGTAYYASAIETELGDGWIVFTSYHLQRGGWNIAFAQYDFGECESALIVYAQYPMEPYEDFGFDTGYPFGYYRRRWPMYWHLLIL